MDVELYSKLLDRSEDPSSAPNERKIASRKVKEIEAAHPTIRSAYLQAQAKQTILEALPNLGESPQAKALRRAQAWGIEFTIQRGQDLAVSLAESIMGRAQNKEAEEAPSWEDDIEGSFSTEEDMEDNVIIVIDEFAIGLGTIQEIAQDPEESQAFVQRLIELCTEEE